MSAVIEMPISESYSVVTPYDARRVLKSGPRFGDVRHINAHRILELYQLAVRCTNIEGFCTCPGDQRCYRFHRGKPKRVSLFYADRERLEAIIERLIELGYVQYGEYAEITFWNC